MSKLSRLRDNIAALQEAFEPKNGEYDYEVLEKYSGFGGLGFVLTRTVTTIRYGCMSCCTSTATASRSIRSGCSR